MKTKWSMIWGMLLVAGCAQAQLSVSFDGLEKYAKNSYFMAVFVTDTSDQFVKTLGVWGGKRETHWDWWSSFNTLTPYTGWASVPAEPALDVRVTKTRNFKTEKGRNGPYAVKWDLCDAAGKVVSNGIYRIHFEVCSDGEKGRTSRHQLIDFVKDDQSLKRTVEAKAPFPPITLDYQPLRMNP